MLDLCQVFRQDASHLSRPLSTHDSAKQKYDLLSGAWVCIPEITDAPPTPRNGLDRVARSKEARSAKMAISYLTAKED